MALRKGPRSFRELKSSHQGRPEPGSGVQLNWPALTSALSSCRLDDSLGRVEEVTGFLVLASGLSVRIGEVCRLVPGDGRIDSGVLAEVVAFREGRVLMLPFGDTQGLGPGALVTPTGHLPQAKVGNGLLGRIIDGMGRPLDRKGEIFETDTRDLYAQPPDPLCRKPISRVLDIGVRAVDGLLTCGQGQRVGIFSGAGVGKSTLLGMIARNTSADVNVIALIGERGSEVRRFIENALGPAGLARSVVVVVTSAEPAMLRRRGAFLATTIAEWFRDRGSNVLLMMDSLTRFAHAQRDVGLATGETASSRGYTPSVFSALPQLLERSGTSDQGSITGLYTVLVEGDDINEPVSDTARGLLDGHIVLSRELAQRGWFPAIDVLDSVSRSMMDLVSLEHAARADKVRAYLAAFKEVEDLVNMGEYERGANLLADEAIDRRKEVMQYLGQTVSDSCGFGSSQEQLRTLTR